MSQHLYTFHQLISHLGHGVIGSCFCDGDDFAPTPDAAAEALALLPPTERALVAHAVPSRQWEFARTRLLAHELLSTLGYPRGELLRDEQRAPLWPAGVCGTLTHTHGFQGALVATTDRVLTLGLDAERAQPLFPDVLESIASTGERQHLSQQAVHLPLDTVLFSAKEALYKAWYPVTGAWLGFEDAELKLIVDSVTSEASKTTTHLSGSGRFSARVEEQLLALYADISPQCSEFAECSGVWVVDKGLIVTALVIPTPHVD